MSINFIQKGNTVTVSAAAAASSGDVVKIGSIIGVAAGNAAIGEALDIHVVGVWSLPKVSADVMALGDKVYWDSTAGLVTKTATANTLLGVAIAAAGASTGSVPVRLNGSF